MRQLMIKTTVKAAGKNISVCTTLSDPRTDPSDNEDCSLQIRRINNIPNNITDVAALTAFKQTMDCTAYTPGCARMEFNYCELGAGKLIK